MKLYLGGKDQSSALSFFANVGRFYWIESSPTIIPIASSRIFGVSDDFLWRMAMVSQKGRTRFCDRLLDITITFPLVLHCKCLPGLNKHSHRKGI